MACLLALAVHVHATEGRAAPGASPPNLVAAVPSGFTPPLPTDGSLGFSYTRAPAVTGCSQSTEAELRDLVIAVVHNDPFAPPGKAPTFTLHVEMTRPSHDLYRATFSLFDAKGAPRGVSLVDDETCDGAHLKLLASIALLLQPRPEKPCDAECRGALEEATRNRVRAELRDKELPRIREEARQAARKEMEDERRRDFRAVVGAGATVALNLAADPGFGFWLSAEVRGDRWSMGLEMRALLPARAFEVAGGSALAQASATGLLVPCLRWRWLGGCGIVEGGGVFVTGQGITASSGLTSGLLGLGVRARVDLPIAAGFEARLSADLMGYPVALAVQGSAGGQPSSFEAPRRVAGLVALGLARSFE
jgi:hypothetical protein